LDSPPKRVIKMIKSIGGELSQKEGRRGEKENYLPREMMTS